MLLPSSRPGARFVASVRRSVAALAMVFVAVFVMAGLALPGSASAETRRHTIAGTFSSGAGSFSGTYDYDSATRLLSNVNIALTAGGDRPAATLVSGHVFNSSGDLVFCDSNPCALPAEYIYVSGGEAAASGGMFSGDCTRADQGYITTGCVNGITRRSGTYTQTLGPLAPTVTGLSTTAGPAVGGNTVVITGTNFTGATGVTFGANAATSFTVDSATQITAVVPPLGQELLGGNTIGAEVSVTTAGGTSSTAGSADDYRYVGVPQPPLITTVYDGSIYSLNQIEIAGGASGSTSVEVFVDDASIGTTSVDSGNGNWTLMSPTLSDGSHTVYAVAISAGGRSASSATVTFTVDTIAPSVPVITSPVSGSIQQGITTISGTGEANTFVNVYINDGTTPPEVGAQANVGPVQVPEGYYAIGGTEVDANGRWTLVRRTREVVPSAQAIGRGPQAVGETPVSLLAVGSDQAGNRSDPSAIVTLTTDSVVPVTPTVTSPAPGSTVNTATPTFTGRGEPGSLITVYVDGNEWGQTYVDQSGNWTDNGQQAAIKGPQAGVRAGLSAGPHSWYVTSEDAAGNVSAPSTPISFVVVLVAIDQTSVPNGAVASAYSQTLTATGGTAPYSFALTGGALPAGVTLSSGGVLSGTPTAGGAFSFTVTVTDSISQSASQAFSLTVSAPTIAATSTVPAGRRGFAYSQTLVGSGGTGPYTFALQSGALPAGITLTSGGVLSGTPTVIGSFPIGVLVTDSSTGTGPYSSTVNLTLVVNAATISVTPTTLPSVMAGLPFDQNLTATGGAGTYSYAVTGGALPSGITLTAAGRLAGRSYTVGAFNFTVTATDSFSNTGSVALVLSVVSRPDPSADPDVRALDTAQAEATRRLIGTQTDNFARRLELLNSGGGDQPLTNGLIFNAGISALGLQADPRNRLAGGRVFDRQTVDPDRAELDAMLWPTSDAPGSRQGGGNDGAPVGGFGLGQGGGSYGGLTIDGSQSGLNTGQSGGYAPAAPARGGARIWTGGSVTIGERDGETGQAEFNVRSSGVSMGADMALSPTLDLGFGGGFGEESAEIGQADTEVDTTSVVGVVYGSWRPEAGVHLDALIGFGQLDFDMQRRVSIDGSLVQGQREGDAVFGSLGLGFDRVVMTGRLNTYGRVETLNAELGAYTETGSPFWALSYEARDVESLQGVLGARYVWNYQMRDSAWTPSVRIEYRREFADGGTQSLSYADWLGGPVYQIRSSGWDRSEFNLGLGLNRTGADGWTFATEAGARMSANEAAATLRLALSRKF